MNTTIIFTLIAVLSVSLISAIGLVGFLFSESILKKISGGLVALAVGALFGDVFIHILPEISENWTTVTSVSILSGIVFFALVEKVLHWHHHHGSHKDCDHKSQPASATMLVIGDAVHNFIDGALIATSFLVSFELGLATTVAVILHEIPQEISDFGALIALGVKAKKAFWLNLLSALTAVIGALLVFIVGDQTDTFTTYLLPFTAGGFIYVAGTDLLPEIKTTTKISNIFWHLGLIILGISLMVLLTVFE